MSALQRKVEAMEKVGAGALADQALQKLLRLQVQKYEKQLEAVQRELEPFEQQYSMRSEECHRRFMARESEMPLISWSGWVSMTTCSCTGNALKLCGQRLRHD